MRTTEAYADLLRLRRPIVTTGEAAARLDLPRYAASKILDRLARDGIVRKIRRGLWSVSGRVDPLLVPEHLVAPYPCYISLWTALYHHDMIEQIPREIYVISLDRSKRIATSVGPFVIHHVHPDLFAGFETLNGVRIALPEKALFDTVYLGSIRGKGYARLPEVELPSTFSTRRLRRWVKRIPSRRLRSLVNQRLNSIMAHAVGRQ